MNMTVITDEVQHRELEKPGVQLVRAREQKGYSQEYVAGRLHLRVRIIELLEADDYEHMPEPVFIKGYLRAYAKLLGIPSDPLLALYNSMHITERKVEKALWQMKRETHKGEQIVRLLTGVIAVAAVVAIAFWWQNNKDNQQFIPLKNTQILVEENKADLKLTDISKLHSVISPNKIEMSPMEAQGG